MSDRWSHLLEDWNSSNTRRLDDVLPNWLIRYINYKKMSSFKKVQSYKINDSLIVTEFLLYCLFYFIKGSDGLVITVDRLVKGMLHRRLRLFKTFLETPQLFFLKRNLRKASLQRIWLVECPKNTPFCIGKSMKRRHWGPDNSVRANRS